MLFNSITNQIVQMILSIVCFCCCCFNQSLTAEQKILVSIHENDTTTQCKIICITVNYQIVHLSSKLFFSVLSNKPNALNKKKTN